MVPLRGATVSLPLVASRAKRHTATPTPLFRGSSGVVNWRRPFYCGVFQVLRSRLNFPTPCRSPCLPACTIFGGLCYGCQVGPAEENELILTAVLDALHETLLSLLRGQVKNIPCFLEYVSVSFFNLPMFRFFFLSRNWNRCGSWVCWVILMGKER